MKNITIFHLKIIIFTVVKNHCILHERVFVMRKKCSNQWVQAQTAILIVNHKGIIFAKPHK